MSKLKTKEERELYRKYHTPSCGNLNSIKLNAIFINKSLKGGYTKEHESMKFDLSWEARGNDENYIVEAERKATEKEAVMFKLKSNKKIVDFVNLSQQQEYEIIHKHESDLQIKFYRSNGVIPIIVGDFIICSVCNLKYPRRNKGNVCHNCKGGI
jgi:hypothetical protein